MHRFISYILGAILCVGYLQVDAQQKTAAALDQFEKPYDPEEDAQQALDSLLLVAKATNKNIIVQAGGNWCIWCLRFNNYIHADHDLRKLVNDKLLYYHLNYSKENKNEAVFQRYAPTGNQLGYPFFIVLNGQGEVLAVRESGSLEAGEGYDKAKVTAFFTEFIKK